MTREQNVDLVGCSETINELRAEIERVSHSDAKVLITEMSFIRPNHRREKIHKFGHMHLDDFLERADRFKNELIVCGHFSTRYHPNEVRKLLEAKLPASLKSRVKLWV